jgi:agmatinase
VTVDLDVFDPAFIPSTGTPEPGGLDWYEVTEVLKAVAEERVIVGFDVVELCPSGEKSSDFLAAKLVYKMLSYRFCKGG